MVTRGMVAGCVALLAAGCSSSSSYDGWERSGAWTSSTTYGYYRAEPEPRPALPDDGSIEVGLIEARTTREGCSAAVSDALAGASVEGWSLEQATRAVSRCFRLGAREGARSVVAAHPDLMAWDDLEEGMAVDCRYVGGAMELTVTRTDARRAVGVVFDPGTFGVATADVGREQDWVSPESERRFGEWPTPQDLAFLRAPVVVLALGEHVQVVRVPVACASFERGSPDVGDVYTLSRLEAGSPVDRLMVELCSGDQLPADEPEAQIAVWMARDDVTWEAFAAHGTLATFGSGAAIRPRHASGAASVLVRSGVDPRTRRFFGWVPPAPIAEPAPEAAPEPAPDAEPGKVS